MPHDHDYIRRLLDLRDGPRVPIAWLLLPWGAAVWWSAGVVRGLFLAQPPHDSGLIAFFVIVVGRQFLIFGGPGTIATWAWLYYAWPDHPRVLCWGAAMGLIGLGAFPARAGVVAPLIVSLCMVGAVIEQAIAMRSMRRRDARAAAAA